MGRIADFYASGNRTLSGDKWYHYFDIYEHHFNRYVGKSPVIVEVGVQGGGSMEMWLNYFGPGVQVHGIDIDYQAVERCAHLPVKIHIGDQANPIFWTQFKEQVPHVDILIDDGGHTWMQQLVTLNEMLFHLADDGIYLCEDIHTSYRPEYGRKGIPPFTESIKRLVDELNGRHWRHETQFTRSVASMHLYESVVVIQRGHVNTQRRVKSAPSAYRR